MPATKKQEFMDAIGAGKLSKVKTMVEKEGMHPNRLINKFVTPLMLAADYGHGSILKYLIKAGANPGAKTRSGVTALLHAVEGKTYKEDYVDPPRPESVRILLGDPRTDVNAIWNTGYHRVSVLAWAVVKATSHKEAGRPWWFEDRLKIVQLLLEHPALDTAERLKQQKEVAALDGTNKELKRLFGVA
jgi:hypothetical protein